ncbi:MAG: alpha-amylase family glycosyl hydrolase [Hyphomicrobiales bacterium]
MRVPHDMPSARAARAAAPIAALLATLATATAALTAAASVLLGAPAAALAGTVTATPSAAVAPAPAWNLGWARGAVFYEIFVRSFQDSNGDGIGDFNGLTSRLDYLNDGDPKTHDDLGVDAIWLMPIFASPSYHGYDVTDYEHVNPQYGTEADFDRLLASAHRRGIRVIVDLVLNHTSAQHPWFESASGDTASPYRDWYVWSPTDPGWGQPWNPGGQSWHRATGGYYYGLFWGGMPDLNFRNPKVRAEMERIAEYWLRRGVDGFRLDATRHLIEDGPGAGQSDTPETHAFLREFSACVRRVKPNAILIGENWTDTATIADYFGKPDSAGFGNELPCNFDFPLAASIVDGVKSGDASRIAGVLADVARTYPAGALDAPFLTNHDMQRVATQLGDRADRLRSACAVLLTLPGAPFLYYGEEIGMQNGRGGSDEFKRTPMAWTAAKDGGFSTHDPWFGFAPGKARANVAAEEQDRGSLLRRYVELIRVRHATPALLRGGLTLVTRPDATTPVLAFVRGDGDDRVLVAHNLGDAAATAGPYALEARRFREIFVDPKVGAPSRAAAGVTIQLPPHATGIWKVEGK